VLLRTSAPRSELNLGIKTSRWRPVDRLDLHLAVSTSAAGRSFATFRIFFRWPLQSRFTFLSSRRSGQLLLKIPDGGRCRQQREEHQDPEGNVGKKVRQNC
jgi:hypothetical protein